MAWIDPNGCNRPHNFLRHPDGKLRAYHTDHKECEIIEYDFTGWFE